MGCEAGVTNQGQQKDRSRIYIDEQLPPKWHEIEKRIWTATMIVDICNSKLRTFCHRRRHDFIRHHIFITIDQKL